MKIIPANLIKLEPGKTLEFTYDLCQRYGRPDDTGGFHLYLPSDEYTIQTTHHTWNADENRKGRRLPSNVASFSVIEPEDEEKEAHDLFKKAYHLDALSKGKERRNAIAYYRKLLSQYPNSVYASQSLYGIIVIKVISLNDKRGAIEECKELIHIYPDSELAVRSLENIACALTNLRENERIPIEIMKIAQEHKGTKIEKKANEIIEKWKKGKYK